MDLIEQALKEQEDMTPESGFNVVGFDDSGGPLEWGLYLIGNFSSEEEAQAELEKRQAEDPEGKFHVFSANKERSDKMKTFLSGQED